MFPFDDVIMHLYFLVIILAQCRVVLIHIKSFTHSVKSVHTPIGGGVGWGGLSRQKMLLCTRGNQSIFTLLKLWHVVGMDLISIQLLVEDNCMPQMKEI